ncbi:MAG: hypothetical protein ACJ8JD_03570 [Chthoniobacterales bacterium]
MQPSEALGVAAQVAVTLAGFAGIVVVFRPQSVHQWSALDKFRLQLLLTNSALPLADALFGMLLLTVTPPIASIWQWCSGVAFSAQILVVVLVRNPTRHIPREQFASINKFLYYGVALMGTAAMALQAINMARWNLFWPFFAMIFMHLIAALAQFIRMVLLPPHDK